LLYFVFSEYHYLLSSQYYIRALSLHGPNGNRKRNKTCAFYPRTCDVWELEEEVEEEEDDALCKFSGSTFHSK